MPPHDSSVWCGNSAAHPFLTGRRFVPVCFQSSSCVHSQFWRRHHLRKIFFDSLNLLPAGLVLPRLFSGRPSDLQPGEMFNLVLGNFPFWFEMLNLILLLSTFCLGVFHLAFSFPIEAVVSKLRPIVAVFGLCFPSTSTEKCI